MSTTHRKWRSFAAFTAAAALAISACGGDDDDAADTTTAAPDTTAAAPATTAAPDETEAPDDPEPADTTAPADTEPEETSPPTTEAEDELDLGTFEPISGVPGVTDDAISFGMLGTGPANPLGYCLMDCFQGGAQAYFDYVNSLGGVHGRQLQFSQVLDDELGNNQLRALELTQAQDVFGVFLAPIIFPGLVELGNAGIPTFTTPPASGDANGFDNVFVAGGTLCTRCPRKHTVQSAVVAGATKVASLGLGASQASKDCANNNMASFEQWGPAVGIEAVYLNDTLTYGFPNGVAPEVTAMKDAGVDFIVTCIDISSVIVLEQELERQGMTNVKVAMPQGYGDTEFIASNADLLEGNTLALIFRPFEADIAGTGIETFLDWMEQGGYEVTDNALYAWMGAELAVKALVAAGPQFDRASMIAAANQITDFTAEGITAPVDWSVQHTAPTPEDPITNAGPYDCMAYVVIRGGTVELAADPSTPWYCFDPTDQEWHDAEEMNFE